MKKDYVTRKEVMETVARLKKENEILEEKNKALTRKLVASGGFISTVAFVVTVAVAITLAIFLVVGYLVFK